jgi:hypothetical protein
MQQSESRYPIKSWRTVYAIVIGVLVLDIILLYILTITYS